MDLTEAFRRIETMTGAFEQGAVDLIVERREEAIPELLRIVETTVDRASELAQEEDYIAHVYAMYLLAQFRETRAYPPAVRFALLPEAALDTLGEGFVTEGLGNVLASVCGGDLAGIQSIIENENASGWARGAALGSLLTLVASGEKSRGEIVSYLATLYRGKLARQGSQVWNELVSCSADLYPGELLADIKRAFREELVEDGYVDLEEIEAEMKAGKEEVLARLTGNPNHRLIHDVAEEMAWWDCFQEKETEPSRPVEPMQPASIPVRTEKLTVTNVITRPNLNPKVGRNDPCPCGSGKKYKKCCGQ